MPYRSEIYDDPGQHEENVRRRSRNQRFANNAAFHDINWDYYPHHELYDMIMSADVTTMGQRAQTWKQVADGIRATTDDVQRTVQRLLDTWRGEAAVRAGGSITRLTQWADDANDRSTRIAAGLNRYTEAVEQAQHAMPPPEFAYAKQNFTQGFDVKGTGGPSTAILIAQLLNDHQPDFKKHQEAHARAVEVMRVYASGSQEAHNTTPWLETPPSSTVQPGPWENPSPQTRPPVDPSGPTDPPNRPPLPVPGPGSGTGGGVPGDLNGDGIPDGTTPGGFTPSGTGPGPGSGPGIAAGLGGGVGAGAGADLARGGPGSAGLGGMAGAGPAAARGGGAGMAGARGAAGAGAFPPFGAGGAGAQGEEDKEHKNKFDEGLDLFDDLPPAYPPVFGA